jgi:hypothetical protein
MPMSLTDRRVLQFADGSQARQHVLDSRFKLDVSIPGAHFLVKQTNILGKFLTLDVHVLDVNFTPRCCLPVLNTGLNNENVVPELLQIINQLTNFLTIAGVAFTFNIFNSLLHCLKSLNSGTLTSKSDPDSLIAAISNSSL